MLNARATAPALAAISLREHALVESTCEGDLVPFWAEAASSECPCAKCEHARMDAYYEAREEAEHREYLQDLAEEREREALLVEAAQWCPEPPSTREGRVVPVEWEDARCGRRYWTQVDPGQLDREIWIMLRAGYLLSDVAG